MYIFILFFLLLIKTNRFKLAKPQTPNQSRVSNKSTVCRKRLSLLRQRTCFLGVIHTSISLSASKLMPIRFCLNVLRVESLNSQNFIYKYLFSKRRRRRRRRQCVSKKSCPTRDALNEVNEVIIYFNLLLRNIMQYICMQLVSFFIEVYSH